MARDGLLIGQVAARSGVSRKALRLYEAAGILPAPRRTASRYRVYGEDALALLAFVSQARRLGFTLAQVKEIVALKRAGQVPCPHVRDLVRRKAAELDRAAADLAVMRRRLHGLLRSWRAYSGRAAQVCPHIEHSAMPKLRRTP
jgi:DNA-binding transcriptional MerR regulator